MSEPITYLPPPDPAPAGEIIPIGPPQWQAQYRELARLVVAGCASPHTRRVYARHIEEFFTSRHPLTRDGVLTWLERLRVTQLLKPQSWNIRLSAIKKLVTEAEIRGLMSPLDARGVMLIRGQRLRGIKSGNWLTLAGAKQLISLPPRSRLMGKRDACVIALLLGCGLRRDEACRLTWDKYQERDGRMCLVDIQGKGQRVRTVPVLDWARHDINAWKDVCKERDLYGPDWPILRRMTRNVGGHGSLILRDGISPDGVWLIMSKYAREMGMPKLSPHDLRRTLARLMRKSGAGWEQVQFILGHESIVTTQLYVGAIELDEGKAAVDLIPW